MGKILVAGKCLNLGVRGPGEKPSWGEIRSSGTGGRGVWGLGKRWKTVMHTYRFATCLLRFLQKANIIFPQRANLE